MCIGLSIGRSEACIADPTRLVIKEVFPAYMSLDSFLESSIYNLKLNQDAHGGFDYTKEGNLAVGAGNQQISGVLPLYLFKEHWEIARRKFHPLFGFMCTLDPLGYTYSQYVTIAFKVLYRAIETHLENPSEANAQALELIQETCAQMVANNNSLKEEILDKAIAFAKHA